MAKPPLVFHQLQDPGFFAQWFLIQRPHRKKGQTNHPLEKHPDKRSRSAPSERNRAVRGLSW
eukprot:8644005-Pyramimonas_sp.AAC.1